MTLRMNEANLRLFYKFRLIRRSSACSGIDYAFSIRHVDKAAHDDSSILMGLPFLLLTELRRFLRGRLDSACSI